MTANHAITATVELLTAEVRTVMYGRRQVTLGIYRQLDWVDADEIEPFGRVRDDRDGPGRHSVYVVGRNSFDGALARSVLFAPPDTVERDIPAALRGQPLFRMKNSYGLTVADVGRNSGCRVLWPTQPASLRIEDPTMSSDEWYWASEEIRRQAEPYIAPALRGLVAQHDQYRAWKSLPLIVLAAR